MKIRAAVLDRMGAAPPNAVSKPLRIATVELDPPGRGEVLVRIAAGLCHSDLSVINGDRPRPMPMALGHESAGIVEQIGDDMQDLAPGDHVVMVLDGINEGFDRLHEGRAVRQVIGFPQ